MLAIPARHIRDKPSLPHLYVIIVCWVRRSLPSNSSFFEPQDFKGSEKVSGRYIRVCSWHTWTAQDILAPAADAFVTAATVKLTLASNWTSLCASLTNQGAL